MTPLPDPSPALRRRFEIAQTLERAAEEHHGAFRSGRPFLADGRAATCARDHEGGEPSDQESESEGFHIRRIHAVLLLPIDDRYGHELLLDQLDDVPS